ncbi:MAG TPA: type IV toxin-antitoxin system AbiEi family antitoxin domain-containing protein [Acidimicrobiales bacterium]
MSDTAGVLALAEQRFGVLTLARAERHGVSYAQVRALLRQGVLVREADGVFRAVGAPRTYEQQVALAIAAAGGHAWAAGPCAARLWRKGIPWFEQADPEIVVPYGRRSLTDARRFSTVRRTRALAPFDRTTLHGLPITSKRRTVVDCLGAVSEPALFALADDVLFRSDPRGLRAAFARSRRTRHARTMDRILAPWEHDGPPPESPKEMSLVRVLLDAGLPLPERQVPIVDPATGRTVARADHGYVAARLAIEYLGQRDHGLRQAHGDALRHTDLEAMGWTAAYARKDDLAHPQPFVARVIALLDARLPERHPLRRHLRAG